MLPTGEKSRKELAEEKIERVAGGVRDAERISDVLEFFAVERAAEGGSRRANVERGGNDEYRQGKELRGITLAISESHALQLFLRRLQKSTPGCRLRILLS